MSQKQLTVLSQFKKNKNNSCIIVVLHFEKNKNKNRNSTIYLKAGLIQSMLDMYIFIYDNIEGFVVVYYTS